MSDSEGDGPAEERRKRIDWSKYFDEGAWSRIQSRSFGLGTFSAFGGFFYAVRKTLEILPTSLRFALWATYLGIPAFAGAELVRHKMGGEYPSNHLATGMVFGAGLSGVVTTCGAAAGFGLSSAWAGWRRFQAIRASRQVAISMGIPAKGYGDFVPWWLPFASMPPDDDFLIAEKRVLALQKDINAIRIALYYYEKEQAERDAELEG